MGRVACARAAAERDSLPHAVRDGVRRLPTNAHHARMQHCPRTLITRMQHCPRTLITRACKTHIQRSSRRMQHAHTAFICVSLVARRPLHATASRWWRAGRCMQAAQLHALRPLQVRGDGLNLACITVGGEHAQARAAHLAVDLTLWEFGHLALCLRYSGVRRRRLCVQSCAARLPVPRDGAAAAHVIAAQWGRGSVGPPKHGV